jgi:anti-anti-sigma regulatory factor
MMTIVPLRKVAGQAILAGRLPGDALRPLLESLLSAASSGAIVVLDFAGISVVTASFFLAAFKGLWERDVFPVIANPSPDVREEIEWALKVASLKALFGTLKNGHLSTVEPVNLDATEAATYGKVKALGGRATASDLHAGDRSVLPTAWSNRLALLYRYRLLRRENVGRQLVYTVCER